ncbi:MAG TPA: ATP-binding protein [Stellaceae bacterium]|jgi:signal transduction histidine kinase|nr:ATP-binding protein [Stellaceae bacterium]
MADSAYDITRDHGFAVRESAMLLPVLRLVRHATAADLVAVCRVAADGLAYPLDCLPADALTIPFPARSDTGADLLPRQGAAIEALDIEVPPSLGIRQVLPIPLNAGALLLLGWQGTMPQPQSIRELLADTAAVIVSALGSDRDRQSLALQRSRVQAIISTIQEGIVVHPEDGSPALVNPTAADWLAIPSGTVGVEIVAEKLGEIRRTARKPVTAEAVYREWAGAAPYYLEWRSFDGSELLITFHPIAGGGGWLWVLERAEQTKRTEWLRAQTQELQRMASALEEERRRAIAAKIQADEANRSKSAFLATMSHELRTPLNAIIGFSELIRADLHGDGISQRYRGYLDDIHASGLHLLSLINDILDLSKIEAGKMEPHIEEFEPTELIDMCMKLVQGMAQTSRITLVPQLDHGLRTMRADRRMSKQVVVNLISNAIKFSDPGQQVFIRLSQDARGLTIEVVDHGIGMRPEDIATALEPFGQVNADLAHRQAGTGLGLPLAKALMELHGGWLTIDSTPSKGTTCAVFFPAGTVNRSATQIDFAAMKRNAARPL